MPYAIARISTQHEYQYETVYVTKIKALEKYPGTEKKGEGVLQKYEQ